MLSKTEATVSCQVLQYKLLLQYTRPHIQLRHDFLLPTALLGVANGITSSIAGFVPASVPRPVAKAGVLGVSGLIAFWIFGKASST